MNTPLPCESTFWPNGEVRGWLSSLRSDVILSYWTLSSILGIATVRRKAPGTALSWLGSARCEVPPNLCSPHPAVSQPSAAWLSQGVADRVPNPAQSQTAASGATLDIQSCYFSLTRGSLHLRWNEFRLTFLLLLADSSPWLAQHGHFTPAHCYP